jgi:hypothetical protein
MSSITLNSPAPTVEPPVEEPSVEPAPPETEPDTDPRESPAPDEPFKFPDPGQEPIPTIVPDPCRRHTTCRYGELATEDAKKHIIAERRSLTV